MNTTQFREEAYRLVDFIADYHLNVHKLPPAPNVKPGFLINQLPKTPPQEPEQFDDILKDVENLILPGLMHWSHPHFYGYFPGANSMPSNLADMLCNGLGVQAFNYHSCPAASELEPLMMDWFARALGLPEVFQSDHSTHGGGMIMGNASEGTLLALLAARDVHIKKHLQNYPDKNRHSVQYKLVAYRSSQAHSSVEKAGLIASIQMRSLPTNAQRQLDCDELHKMIISDLNNGEIPFLVIASVGTTNSGACDNLNQVGPICQKYSLWLHVDAAYAGMACLCPEYRDIINGIEYVQSIGINPSKWGLINFDTAFFWTQRVHLVEEVLCIKPNYLEFQPHPPQQPRLENRQLATTRRFRSLKTWFTVRLYGIENMQFYIRTTIKIAKLLDRKFQENAKFEVVEATRLALICFRLIGSNELNMRYLETILEDGRVYLVPGMFQEQNLYFLRLSVNYQYMTEELAIQGFHILQDIAETTYKKFNSSPK